MGTLIVLFVLVSITFAVDDKWAIEPAIVSGEPVPPHSYPFMAAINWVTYTPVTRSTLACGGALLSRQWVLTAAHCLSQTPRLGSLYVHLGSHQNRADESGVTRVEVNRRTSIIHPDFVAGRTVGPDDLALLNMFEMVTFSNRIQAIVLPQPGTIPTGTAIFTGWGSVRTDGRGTSLTLQQVELPFITVEHCRNLLNAMERDGNLVAKTHVCTGPRLGRAICTGDTGGPAFQREGDKFVLRGIASWAIEPCAHLSGPSGVFKRVSAYIDWIRLHTGITPP